MPAAFGLSPLLCPYSQSAAFEQERAEAAAHPAQEPACSPRSTRLLGAHNCPSALRPMPPESPSLPSNTGPPHRGRLWCSQSGRWLCPSRRATATTLTGSCPPLELDGLQADPNPYQIQAGKLLPFIP